MSAATTTPATAPAVGAATHRVTFPRLLRSERIKLFTVRSTTWTLGTFFVGFVGLALLISLAFANASDEGVDPGIGPVAALAVLQPVVQLAQVAVVVLGALAITSEYSTGMIRASLAAAPRRLGVLWAKAIVVWVVVFVVSAVAVGIAMSLQRLLFDSKGLSVDLGDSQIQRALLGTALYLATIALLAFALGALLRHSAATLGIALAVLIVLPIVFSAIPWDPLHTMFPYLPNVAGTQIMATDAQIEFSNAASEELQGLSAWGGFAVLWAYVVVLLGAAAIQLKRRDA
ncbi:ABC transporter permease [Cellulomonas composti]|uniref:ABC transporter permease n=1 Tax=Cellulomonas composti TaxID=266130 RepID=A0A511JAB6_9CELL|nr:ABC transporter permease [Cellulomonas composti]GEL94932.1 ABC transporter permease [Cellulomonas composti]